MRWIWGLVLVLVLAVGGGCAKKQVLYSKAEPTGEAVNAVKTVVPSPSQQGQPETKAEVQPPGSKSDGPLFVLHRWKEDDSLSFLSIYYTGKLDHQKTIEEANPELSFGGRLPPGTPVWIPAEIIRPEVINNFQPIARTEKADELPPTPLDRGVMHQVKGRETMAMIAAFYTGQAQMAPNIAAANPDLDPQEVLNKGTKVFVPSSLILNELKPRLTFVDRPRPEGAAPPPPALGGGTKLGEEDLAPTQGQGAEVKAASSQPVTPKAAPGSQASPKAAPAQTQPVRAGTTHKGPSKHRPG